MAPKKTHLLIASSSPDEAVTRCILNHKRRLPFDIDIVLIHEILMDFEINDELSDKGSVIRWFKNDKIFISNHSHFLLNRTLLVSDTLFLNFIKKDREYAKREFEAYLGYSFNSFESVGTQTVNGLCEALFSLPEQWQKITSHSQLKTPHYYWGPKDHCHLKKDIVYSDIYNLFNWSPTTLEPKKSHIFCFEKPPGDPLFVLSVGEKIQITQSCQISVQTKQYIYQILQNIQRCFGYFIFETLLFIHPSQIYFGCINLELTHTSKQEYFDDFISKHLIQEYFKCLN